MRTVRLVAILVLVALLATPVLALDVSSIQCGLNVVYLGDLDSNVMSKCGAPTYTGQDRWTYDDGYSDTYVVIHFGAGGPYRRRVMRIELVYRRAP
ncbi:MAG: DUF2845 domain-containing protein [Deltaproteobacteria bacterium]|nr:DUF2845 domain-containing protein [Deltaproteobacteria bacterium]MBW2120357.1 DUF2845 domain-containing protein [Deltaproteobacteria bacterium]